MNPVRTEIKRDAKGRGIGDTTPADPITRLKQDETAVDGGDPPRRRDAGSAGSDDCRLTACSRIGSRDNRPVANFSTAVGRCFFVTNGEGR